MAEKARAHSLKVPSITPFWQRIPQFFRYPFYSGPLITLVALSLASFFTTFSFLGLFFQLAILFFFLRLALRVMEQTALGRLHPDQYMFQVDANSGPSVWGLYGLCLGWLILVIVCSIFLGHFGAFISTLLFSVFLPASIMVYVITHSVWQSLNPGQLTHVVKSIGMPYLGLVVLLFITSQGSNFALAFIAEHATRFLFLWIPLLAFITMYNTLIMFNMMGYALYQYHQELGYDVKVGFEDADDGTSTKEVRPASAQKEDALEEEIAELLSQDRAEEALDVAYEAQRLNPGNPKYAERYFKLLVFAQKEERAMSYAKRAIDALLANAQFAGAFKLYKECQTLGDFVPETGAQVFGLAKGARDAGLPDEALALIRGFDKRYTGHPDIPDVYLFSAQLLVDHYHEPAKALKILHVLVKRYPHHNLRAEAERQITVLTRRLAAKPAKV